MTRAIVAVKDRELRAQIEKQSRRKLVQVRGEARSETDAAVVAHLSESQADLGVAGLGIGDTVRPPSPEELVAGVRVRVRGLPSPVLLRRRDGMSAEIEAGPLRMKVPVAEITAIVTDGDAQRMAGGSVAAKAARASSSGVTVHAAPADRDASDSPGEINVIGCTVEEATRRVDKFIDTAVLAGAPQVRVIHGHGTGALRRGLAEFLSGHPLVESVHAEAQERGGTAVTVVELRG